MFSAVVTAFIIESYKKLSTDSGDETVNMLKAISMEIVMTSSGKPINSVTPEEEDLHSNIEMALHKHRAEKKEAEKEAEKESENSTE